MTNDLSSVPNRKIQSYLIGGLIGLAVGLLAAYFYTRVAEENGANGPAKIKSMDALKLAVSLLSLVRQITDMGASSSKK